MDVQVFDGDREILFEDKSGSQYTLYIDSEGLWSFTDDNYTPEQASLTAQESMIEKAIVDELAIQPKDAKFTVLENGQFEWSLPNSDDLSIDYWAGDLTLGLKQDGSVYSLTYNLPKKAIYTGSKHTITYRSIANKARGISPNKKKCTDN
ncbi:hypothetical protein [Lysinibacillus sp. Ag94]|uniref:hypothetical protein n=1 Tax=Lysinibacillus sp. Ag94 TaxID=2936682 RepID=UPI00200C2AFB|nr:hypothetical protein [Lysinibacillus sp. Ag94]UPW81534.1 hypothetical protein MY533_12285 [Lysinibacillus sp. Ag94]